MAGDLATNEFLVVRRRSTARSATATPAAPSAPMHVLHEYGPSVQLGIALDDRPPRFARGAAPSPAMDDVDAEDLELDPVGQLGLEAFELRSSDTFRERAAARPDNNTHWDAKGPTFAPDPPADDGDDAAGGGGRVRAANQARIPQPLVGRVAVGLVIVSGPGRLGFTTEEQRHIVAQVQNGLTWLGTQSAAAAITWAHDIQTPTIDAPPGASTNDYAALEAAFRDPALDAMGFGPGVQGVTDAVQALVASTQSDSGYLAFFTKYPTGHFAYAWPTNAYLVMTYENDGWSPTGIDRVFAHETCHLFGAPDEYGSSRCDCGGTWGTSGGPNANCENCEGSTTPDCIMRVNVWAMCQPTRGHLGFPD